MGQFGRIASRKDLPAKKVTVGYVKAAMKRTDGGVNSPERAKRKPRNWKCMKK